MQKKSAFTLAEVLITLAIIGVVAALASPALVGMYQKAKVGPSLRRFVSNMENANEHIFVDRGAVRISDVASNNQEYLEVIGKYLNGTIQKKNETELMQLSDLKLTTKNYSGYTTDAPVQDSLIYTFSTNDAFAVNFYTDDTVKETNRAKANNRGAYKGDICTIYYDINGFETKPNRLGKDIFVFHLDDTGMLIPEGGKQQWNAYVTTTDEQLWKNDKNSLCSEEGVANGASCAGSIADNNWKVVYKY